MKRSSTHAMILALALSLILPSCSALVENITAIFSGEHSMTKDNTSAHEAITKRIKDQYTNRQPDETIMSAAFYDTFKKAQEADESEIGWPDWDYWDCSQGAYAVVSRIDVEVLSSTSAITHITLSYPENEQESFVDMPMVYEQGNWFVDDIITREESGAYSLRNMASAMIE